jgi:hypothetical protein
MALVQYDVIDDGPARPGRASCDLYVFVDEGGKRSHLTAQLIIEVEAG